MNRTLHNFGFGLTLLGIVLTIYSLSLRHYGNAALEALCTLFVILISFLNGD